MLSSQRSIHRAVFSSHASLGFIGLPRLGEASAASRRWLRTTSDFLTCWRTSRRRSLFFPSGISNMTRDLRGASPRQLASRCLCSPSVLFSLITGVWHSRFDDTRPGPAPSQPLLSYGFSFVVFRSNILVVYSSVTVSPCTITTIDLHPLVFGRIVDEATFDRGYTGTWAPQMNKPTTGVNERDFALQRPPVVPIAERAVFTTTVMPVLSYASVFMRVFLAVLRRSLWSHTFDLGSPPLRGAPHGDTVAIHSTVGTSDKEWPSFPPCFLVPAPYIPALTLATGSPVLQLAIVLLRIR